MSLAVGVAVFFSPFPVLGGTTETAVPRNVRSFRTEEE